MIADAKAVARWEHDDPRVSPKTLSSREHDHTMRAYASRREAGRERGQPAPAAVTAVS